MLRSQFETGIQDPGQLPEPRFLICLYWVKRRERTTVRHGASVTERAWVLLLFARDEQGELRGKTDERGDWVTSSTQMEHRF